MNMITYFRYFAILRALPKQGETKYTYAFELLYSVCGFKHTYVTDYAVHCNLKKKLDNY